jgi:hypothetical protein
MVGKAWFEPRYLFDAAAEFRATHGIAMPKYTVLQKFISRVVQQDKKVLKNKLRNHVLSKQQGFLNTIIDDKGKLFLSRFRASAKSVTTTKIKNNLLCINSYGHI